MISNLVLILGDQLFPDHTRLEIDETSLVIMIEDATICRKLKYHKHKLIFVLSAMRHHFRGLEANKRYFELDDSEYSIIKRLEFLLDEYSSITQLKTYMPANKPLRTMLRKLAKERDVKLRFVENPSFMLTRQQFEKKISKRLLMHQFYVKQRKDYGILLDGDNMPLGGAWSHDDQNRKNLPRGTVPPPLPIVDPTQIVLDVIDEVERRFPDHPGTGDNFWLPVTRSDTSRWFENFLEYRFNEFGPYEDAIHTEFPFVYHSVLSPMINIGLITVDEVVAGVLSHNEKHPIHLPSLEGFIRQIIGWREFIHGLYEMASPEYIDSNYFNHTRKMNSSWYDGTIGIPPLDSMIGQLEKYGYAHHIERLMVASNLMVLCEIDPRDCYNWFMELFVDSAEWVMLPNVLGMGLFADGGWFATKPYISSANYILKMSNYTKKSHGEEWINTWQALYWRFVHKHREFFEKSARLSFMIKHLNKLNQDQIKQYYDTSERFISTITL
jgi:deoxyribodipyrimidine photolyase-related protein